MSLEIAEKEAGGATVLTLKGHIVLGDACDSLRERLTQMLAAGKKKIVLELGGVGRVDSSGVGILVEATVLTAKEGGRLKLCHLPRILYNTLYLHHLLQAFEIHASEEEALAAFG